jgi:signal transduction histidine kinase
MIDPHHPAIKSHTPDNTGQPRVPGQPSPLNGHVGIVLAWMMTVLAREGARVAVAEGLRAGRVAERANVLRALHLEALQTFDQICRCSAETGRATDARLTSIRGLALAQADNLRAVVESEGRESRGGLANELKGVTDNLRARGLRVELVITELSREAPPQVTDAIVGAVREALTNTLRHAGVGHAVVRAADVGDGVEVVVRDQGKGFDPARAQSGFGLEHSILRRIAEVGGKVQVRSAPGEGTRIRLTWSRT